MATLRGALRADPQSRSAIARAPHDVAPVQGQATNDLSPDSEDEPGLRFRRAYMIALILASRCLYDSSLNNSNIGNTHQ